MADPLEGLRAALSDRYIIDREIGHGGTATVYLAHDAKNSRPVAIKVLAPELALAVGTERFLREIEIAARLQHPNIVPLHDSGNAKGFLYYVMPYVEGESLRGRLEREGELPVGDALEIARGVAKALTYAHSRDVVHRDIKPENILLSGGEAVVADFGIARAITEAGGDKLTATGLAVGTPLYMSPEQATGSSRLDGRSDLYSLACVIYEMLAGHPPFMGATPREVFARHHLDPVPPLRTARATIPVPVETAVMQALAKVPADRFSTVSQFVTALEATEGGRVHPRRFVVRATVAGVLIAGTAAMAWFGLAREAPLDENKVVVFPLMETPTASGREGTSEEVALMIGSGLEHTEPLRWIDGWTLLDPRQRGDLTLVTTGEERRIAHARGSRWYIDGSIVRRGDSTTVVLRLNDVQGDSLVASASATGAALSPAQVGLQTINQLLPHLLAPGRRIDLSALATRRPAAVASWLQGEREYRRSNFDAALEYFRRAVGEDSGLAVAALRGAEAASWTHQGRLPEARALVKVALAHAAILPTRQTQFARGLAAFFTGEADSAVVWLTRALTDAPDWTEAHMALGEVYYHLLPFLTVDAAPLERKAEREFRAAAADTGFAPPLVHLAEIAIRSGDARAAAQAVERFARFGGDPPTRAELALTLDCVQGGRRAVAWKEAVTLGPLTALGAARSLAATAALPDCAEDGFRAVLADRAASALVWGTALGLQGILAAEGRTSELRALIDSLTNGGLEPASLLYVLDALAGAGVESQATAVADRYRHEYGPDYRGVKTSARWLLASWRIRMRDTADAKHLRGSLVEEAARKSDPQMGRLALALGAQLAALRGDTAGAISVLSALVGTGRVEELQWDLSEPLPAERLLLAELLLARGQARAATVAAAGFDHPGPVAFLPFLPASLALRHRAALAMGQPGLAKQYRQRLEALGQGGLIAVRP